MKLFDCLQNFQQMINTVTSADGSQDSMAEASEAMMQSSTGKAKVGKADPAVASFSEQAPPPYAHSNHIGPSTGPRSPVLIANGWEVYHGGIAWESIRELTYSYVDGDLTLAVRPAKASQEDGIASLFQLKIKEDKIIDGSNLPFSSDRAAPSTIISCTTLGKWSDEMVTVSHGSGTKCVSLKVEPVYHPDDKGVYTIRLGLRKKYDYKISGRTRFKFHLEGYTVRPDPGRPSRGCPKDPWSDPVVSGMLDNDWTPEMAATASPWLKQ